MNRIFFVGFCIAVGLGAVVWIAHIIPKHHPKTSSSSIAIEDTPPEGQAADVVETTKPPVIAIAANSLQLGIRYHVSGKTESVTEKDSSFKNVTSSNSSHTRSEEIGRIVKNEIEGKISAGASTKTGFSLDASGSASYSAQSRDKSTETFSNSNSAADSQAFTSLKNEKEKKTVEWDGSSGFIRTQIGLSNLTGNEISIEHIEYDIREIDPCSQGQNSLGSGVINRANLIATSPQQSTVGNTVGGDLTITLHPGERDFTYLVYIPSLPTDMIINAITRGDLVEFRILDYRLKINGHPYSEYNRVGSGEYFSIDFIGPTGSLRQFFVRQSTSRPLEKTLMALGIGKVLVEESGGTHVLKQIGDVKSTFVDPKSANSESRSGGVWIVGSSPYSADALLVTPRAGARYVVAFVTNEELSRTGSSTQAFHLELPQHINQLTANQESLIEPEVRTKLAQKSDLLPIACLDDVAVGDVISARVDAMEVSYQPKSVDVRSSPDLPQNDWWSLATCLAHEQWAEKDETVIPPEKGVDDLDLQISFNPSDPHRLSIPLSQATGYCGYVHLPDGRHKINFTITPSLLPEGKGKLCFLSSLKQKQITAGRLHRTFSGNDFLLHFCVKWAAPNPEHTVTVYDYKHEVLDGSLTRGHRSVR